MEKISFGEKGLIPAIIQDIDTGKVLMLGYMNEKAWEETLRTGKVHFWSRSRQKLWLKGETSGHFLLVKEIWIDCDEDTLLIKVKPVSGVCHTGHYSCFYRQWNGKDKRWEEKEKKIFSPEEVYGKGD